ncbi:hypothetical protein Tco_0005983 [Tanacetum coccineum]
MSRQYYAIQDCRASGVMAYEINDNYDNESSDDDNDDDDVKKDEEDEEEEEHLAPADPSTVPTDDPVPSS